MAKMFMLFAIINMFLSLFFGIWDWMNQRRLISAIPCGLLSIFLWFLVILTYEGGHNG